MTVVDTSVAVAAAVTWHEQHRAARAVAHATRLIGHVALETYSVLTRLPPPQRVPPAAAQAYLTRTFSLPVLTLDDDAHAALLEELARERVRGGAVYDAFVAATARAVGATLLTLDRRAEPTYRLLGVSYRFAA